MSGSTPTEDSDERDIERHHGESRGAAREGDVPAAPDENDGVVPPGESTLERIRRRYGDEVDPGVALSDPTEEAPSAGVDGALRRLERSSGNDRRYRLEGEIARGGMGAILRVYDEDLRRFLAMKVILGQAPTETHGDTPPVRSEIVQRFLEEAQVTGQLDHPGIVPIHELGVDPAGRVFFTMKLVKGVDFGAVIRALHQGSDDWTRTRALGALLRACEALAFAHSRGVVHRDVKPENLMVGRFGEVYVMDWGLARVVGRTAEEKPRATGDARAPESLVDTDRRHGADSPQLTEDGDVLGTPAYMSPEQARGALGEIGPASDVYSMGAILYHLLSGTMPYCPRVATPRPWMVLRALLEEPPPPIGTMCHDAPPELIAICERAMARDRAHRYADMEELASDLRAYLEGRVVSAHRTGALPELHKWIGRNKTAATAIAAGFLALVIGLVATTYLKGQADRNAQEASREKQNAERETYDAHVQMAAAGHGLGDRVLAELGLEGACGPLADWEYRHLETVIRASRGEIDVHAERIASHPRLGRCAVYTGSTVELWDLEGKRRLLVFEASDGSYVTSLTWSGDGRHLIASHGEQMGQSIWEGDSGRLIDFREVHGTSIGPHYFIVESPNGRFRASSTNWGVSVEDPVAEVDLPRLGFGTLHGLGSPIAELVELTPGEREHAFASYLHFDRRANRLLAGLSSGLLVLIDLVSGEKNAIRACGTEVTCIDTHPDRDEILMTSADHCVELVNPHTDEVRRVWSDGGQRQRDAYAARKRDYKHGLVLDLNPVARFSPGGRHIFFLGESGVLRVLDGERGDVLTSLPCHGHAGVAVEVRSDLELLLTAGADGLRCFDLDRFWVPDDRHSLGGRPRAVAVAPDGREVAIAVETTIRRRGLGQGNGMLAHGWVENLVYDLVYAPNGQSVLVACRNYFRPDTAELTRYEKEGSIERVCSGRGRMAIQGIPDDVRSLATHAASGRVAAGGYDGEIVVFRDTGELRPMLRLQARGVPNGKDEVKRTPLAFSPDGTRLVVGHGRFINLFDLETGVLDASVSLPVGDDVHALSWLGDPSAVIVGLRTQPSIYRVDLRDARCEELASPHLRRGWTSVTALTFLPSGRRFVSGGGDGQVFLWDAVAGKPILNLPRHRAAVADIGYSAFADLLFSVGEDGVLSALHGDPDVRSRFLWLE